MIVNILLIGGPGSGKGTLGNFLNERLNVSHISTGELFRYNISNETQIGLEVKDAIAAGGLAPDELTVNMMESEINNLFTIHNKEFDLVFDGFPRNLVQGPLLDELLGKYNRILNIVFYLNAPDDVLIKRLAERATKEDRPEDLDLEYCKKRIKVFREQTTPLIDFYKERGILVEIDATMSISEVNKLVISELIKIFK